MTEAVLALDVGTSGCRAELLSLDGKSLGGAYREYRLLTPEAGAAEQDPEAWWGGCMACLSEALGQAGEPRVLAVGLAVQGHTWAPTDADYRPLRPALTWLDTRAADIAEHLRRAEPPGFWGRQAGKQPGPWHMLPQLMWLREREPEIMVQARALPTCHDWLMARLTGAPVTDYTNAATTLLLDIRDCQWSPEVLTRYGLEQTMLSPLHPAGSEAGRVVGDAAGLPRDALVAVGAQDQKCAALAAGLTAATVTVSLGTAVAISAPVTAPRFDERCGAIPCFPWLQRGQWVLEAPMSSGGGALRWLRDVATDGPGHSFDQLIAEAEAAWPGAGGVRFLPYLAGAGAPHWRSDATATFSGLTLRTERGHLVRAVLEGVALDIRANLECMRRLGCMPERLRVFGGGARSELWPQIIAAICGLPTERCRQVEAATRGAAMLAAQALGADPAVFALDARPVAVPAGWPEAYERLWQERMAGEGRPAGR